MGGSIFFLVKSKTFEFSVEEGDTYYMLHIFERNRESLRSVFMGKETAKRLLAIVEYLMSNVTTGNFAQTFIEVINIYSATRFQCKWQFFYDLGTYPWLSERLYNGARR